MTERIKHVTSAIVLDIPPSVFIYYNNDTATTI